MLLTSNANLSHYRYVGFGVATSRKNVVNTRIQPSLNILELLFDKTISQPKLILKGLFGTKVVHMHIQPSLNILQLLFDSTISEPEPVSHAKWAFWNSGCEPSIKA